MLHKLPRLATNCLYSFAYPIYITDIIKRVEGGAKHSAVVIVNYVSRLTVIKIAQNKKALLGAFMVR